MEKSPKKKLKRRRSTPIGGSLRGFLIGLGVTVLVALVGLTGLDRPFEDALYDFRMKWFTDLPADQRIVHVDIDDGSLEQLGRWPWPRRRLGRLIDTLTDLGVRLIVLDIIFPEAQAARLELLGVTDRHSGQAGGLLGTAGKLGARDAIFDDKILARSIRESARVLVPMHLQFPLEGKRDPSGIRQSVRRLLSKQFNLTSLELSRQLTLPRRRIERILPGLKQDVANQLVAQRLDSNPHETLDKVAGQLLGHLASGHPDYKFVRLAYNQARSMRLLSRFNMTLAFVSGSGPPGASRSVAPIPELSRSAAGTGFVTVEPDPDGKVRRIRLLGRFRDNIFPQLGFAAFLKLQGLTGQSLSWREGEGLEIRRVDLPSFRVPLDNDGAMLISWALPRRGWEKTFPHVPTAKVGEIWTARQEILRNDRKRRFHLVGLARFLDDRVYLTADLKRTEFERDIRRMWNQGAPSSAVAKKQAQLDPLIKQVAQAEKLLLEMLDEYANAQAKGLTPDELKIRSNARRRRRKWRRIEEEVRFANLHLAQRIARCRRELAFLKDKVCFIGSSATGFADFIPTPVYKRAPGVMVHSNILNSLLQERFMVQTGQMTKLLIILLTGAVVSLFASRYGAIASAVFVSCFLVGLFFFNSVVLFSYMRHWVVLASPMVAVVLAYGSVFTWRQLTEQREKRRITDRFKQYTSPAVVDRIVESPKLLALEGETRVVTCFFSDLAGFTSTSERLGAQRTVAVLNTYLERMSEVLDHYEGTINKFLGDGIFAFFGAPLPQADHARRGCLAALDCQKELDNLLDEQPEANFPRLKMRIGVAAGPAVVGDCGSHRKFDYTCIGDTVNLAARLESANKFFGSRIMVNADAWDGLEADLVARRLGAIQVVGKQQGVEVLELLFRRKDASSELIERLERYHTALDLYTQKQFSPALDAFRACAAEDTDKIIQYYLAQCEHHLTTPPAADWIPTIVLTEK